MRKRVFAVGLATVTASMLVAVSSMAAENTNGKSDSEWIENAAEYYNSLVPEDKPEDEVFCIYEYSDEYRGEFDWSIYNQYFDLDYYTQDSDAFLVSVDTETGEIELSIEIIYDDETCFEVSYEPVTAENIGTLIADLSISTFGNLYEDSAFENHDVKADVSIMYERFRQLANSSFEKAGIGSLEQYGLILAPLEEIDPATPLSKESPYIVSEHEFETGTCKECNKTWADCVRDAIGELQEDEAWRTKLGIWNEYAPGYISIQFYNLGENLSVRYRDLYIKQNRIGNIDYDFTITFVSPEKLEIRYEYEDIFDTSNRNAEGAPIYGYAQCELTASVPPSELTEILSSGSRIEEACSYRVVHFSPDGEEYEYFDNYTEDQINDYLAEKNYSMISQADLCEILSEKAKNYILGIDKSLLEVGTSLEECGIDTAILK